MMNVSPVFPVCINPVTHGLYMTIPRILYRCENYNINKEGPAVIVTHRGGRRFRIAADAIVKPIGLEDGTKACVVDFTVCKIYIAHEQKTCTFNSLSEGVFEIEKRCKEV